MARPRNQSERLARKAANKGHTFVPKAIATTVVEDTDRNPAPEPAPEINIAETRAAIRKIKKAELIAAAERADLSTVGTVQDLRDRLIAHYEQEAGLR